MMMNGQKKICILTPAHYLACFGGAEYQLQLITESLCERKLYEIYYLCRRSKKDYISNEYNIRKIGDKGGISRYGLFFDSWNIYKNLKQIKPDIIYQRVGCAYTGVAAYYARKFGSKLIWHISSDRDIAGYIRSINIKLLTDFIDRVFLIYGIRHANQIVGQTYQQSYLLEKKFGRKCDKIIYNGHPVPENRPMKGDQVNILWIANIRLIKQPELFVNLAREIGKSRNVIFQMIGRSGSGKWFDKLMSKINHTENIKYLGEISQQQVNQKLSEGHILVNTSRYEGFPNTFIQAWMRGVPVISLNVDPDHTIEREKIGFLSRTFPNLCKDVNYLIENKNIRDEMGIHAYDYAKAFHSKEKMVESVIGLFK